MTCFSLAAFCHSRRVWVLPSVPVRPYVLKGIVLVRRLIREVDLLRCAGIPEALWKDQCRLSNALGTSSFRFAHSEVLRPYSTPARPWLMLARMSALSRVIRGVADLLFLSLT